MAFYDACLREEGLRDLRFRSFDQDAFVPLPVDVVALVRGETVEVIDDGLLEEWVSKRRVGSVASRYYVGYPLTAVGDGRDISPLLYMPVELDRVEGTVHLTIADAPQVNHRILEDAGYSIDEAVEFCATIDARMRDGSEGDVDELIEQAIRDVADAAGLEGTSTVDPEYAGGFDRTRSASIRAVQNAAILFASDRLGFTQSTRRELADLAADESIWTNTPLQAVLEGEPPADAEKGDSELIVVSPLSEAQREALKSALSRQLTVVTGPPGTGKSELVLNIVANGLARGETVLVASRNNKAVDVVAERFRGLTDEGTLVRVGRAAYRDRAIALMRRVVEGVRSPRESEVAQAKVSLERVREQRRGFADLARRRAAADVECDERERAWSQLSAQLPATDIKLVQRLGEGHEKLDAEGAQAVYGWVAERAKGRRSVLERLVGLARPRFALDRTWSRIKGVATADPDTYAGIDVGQGEWAAAIDVTRRAAARVQTAAAWRALTEARQRAAGLEDAGSIGQELLAFGGTEAAAGRRFLSLKRQATLADLPERDRKRLAEYLRAVDQLGGTERLGSRMYAQLKRLEETLFTDVQRVFPVWAITTLSARRNLPLRAKLFDLLVVDEASQCDLPSAFPLLARSRRVVVIGDDKQLIHVTPLSLQTEQALAAEAGMSADELVNYSYRDVSLFTLAKHMLGDDARVTLLDEHYRSDPQIIAFSNERFYGTRLNIYTEPERLRGRPPGESAVMWEHVRGTTVRPRTGSAYNAAEVERVCALVEGVIQRQTAAVSVGVVTPFRVQKERLTEALARRLGAQAIDRHLVIADTAHGFQGDERDIVVMSTVVSEGAEPRTVDFVERNPNLFNVAVTRARAQLIVVGDLEVCRARTGLLGELARYVERLRDGEHALGPGQPETDEEELLLEHLTKRGLAPIAQMPVRGLRVDIALTDGERPLAVEVDGTSHATSDGSRLLQDMYRDEKLRRAGWNVLRIPAWQVRLDPGGVASTIERSMVSSGPGAA